MEAGFRWVGRWRVSDQGMFRKCGVWKRVRGPLLLIWNNAEDLYTAESLLGSETRRSWLEYWSAHEN